MRIPRTWHPSVDKDMLALAEKLWVKLMDVSLCHQQNKPLYKEKIKEPKVVPLIFTFDSTKTLGRAIYNQGYNMVAPNGVIGLNSLFLKHPEEARNTILHEYAHLLNHAVYNGKGHDDGFYRIGDRIGEVFGERITRLAQNSEDQTYTMQALRELKASRIKYRVWCPKCGYIWERSRQSTFVKFPTLYTCGVCKTTLELKK